MIIEILDDEVIIDGQRFAKIKDHTPSIADELGKVRGTVEYNGIIAEMLKWYYGSVKYVPWCAVAISYICLQLGLLDDIGGKNENVNQMRIACKNAALEGKGKFFDKNNLPELIKKDDILFWLWDGTEMKNTSSKHVGVAEYDSSTNIIYCIGGNQKDKICTLAYNKNDLYAVYRIGG